MSRTAGLIEKIFSDGLVRTSTGKAISQSTALLTLLPSLTSA